MKTKRMISVLLLATLSLGVISGCTVKKHKPDATIAAAETTEEREREIYGTFAIPDTARNNRVEMQVDSVEVVCWEQVDMFNTVTKKHNLIKAHVVITNLGTEDLELQPKDIRGYIDNEQLTVNTSEMVHEALGINGDVIEQRTVHPGRSETGYVLYEYYRDWTEFEIQYQDTDLDFGIKFKEDDVVTVRTTAAGEEAETSETSESSDETVETTEKVPGLTIPGASNPTSAETTEVQPTVASDESSPSSVPGITIPTATT